MERGSDQATAVRRQTAPAGFWFGGAALYAFAVSLVLLLQPPNDLLDREGISVVLVLAGPVLIGALPLMVKGRIVAWGSALLLAGFAFVSVASVGLFFLPGLVLLVIGAVRAGH